MAIAKVIEVLAQSSEGWQEATEVALQEAQKTVRNIKSIYIKDMQCDVENGQIARYRVNAKITFLVEG
jgi:hypothetical protein